MNRIDINYPRTADQVIIAQNTLIRQVYAWMGAGLAITAFLALVTLSSPTLLFIAYSALNGVTLSVVALVYTANSISSTFVTTAAMFGAMSAYGYMTRRDLSSWGSFLFMGLIGVVIASVVNIFVGSSAVSWIISGLGVIVFTGLTAYDTWKIKAMAATGAGGRKPAILGALTLYLDFINLFLMLLRFTGQRR